MARIKKPSAPDFLKMDLNAPGMSPLHRAGLGGLACTLEALHARQRQDPLPEERLPAPFVDGTPPWDISATSITLRFGKPEGAARYLENLFAHAFSIRSDGLIYLPGQFAQEPPAAVLADLQQGLLGTFLQHGGVRQMHKDPTTVSYDPEGEGIPGVIVQYRACTGFKHQKGWADLVDKKGCIIQGYAKVDGPISPGSVVRHQAYGSQTMIEEPMERIIPLFFAMVGCLALPVNRGVTVLLVPEVTDLKEFIYDRQAMAPGTAKECQISSAADAALQAQIHIRARKTTGNSIPGCYAMTFTSKPWASQQKSRVATLQLPPGEEQRLNKFEIALAHLPIRIALKKIRESTGKGKQKTTTERVESFRADSIVRPLVAENLALGRPWYAGFVNLMIKNNPATDRPLRDQLSYERGGLHAMITEEKMWDDEGARIVVQAVHRAIQQTLGRIREETDGKSGPLSQATKNRWERFRERLRLDLVGAKSQAQARFALTDLFSRSGTNAVLQESWQQILPIILKDWQLVRDLGLLALASYASSREQDSNV